LGERNGAGEKLDEITGLEDCVRVESTLRSLHGHGTLDQIQLTDDALVQKKKKKESDQPSANPVQCKHTQPIG
jgi:hypothetical protein